MQTTKKIHIWEQHGLGVAPFKIVGFQEITTPTVGGVPAKAGSTCDACGTGIKDVFWIQGADGRRFKVGNVCVDKTGDAGLRRVVAAKVRELKTARRHAREAARIAAGMDLLQRADVQAVLTSQPHPLDWRADKGESKAGWVTWMLANSGNAGKLGVMRVIENLVKKLDK